MLKTFSITDIGKRRKLNQDYVYTSEMPVGHLANLFLVADGMGGHAAGETASRICIDTLSSILLHSNEPVSAGTLQSAFQQANTCVLKEASENESLSGMGATLVCAVLFPDEYLAANVGDSRAYYMRDYMQQITKDQTYVQREMDLGHMTYEQARRDPQRNVLLQCIGASPIIEPDFYTGNVDPGSAFLLCSDGFRHTITQEEIYEYLNPLKLFNENTMQEGVNYLTELNKYRQETDNISAVLIRAD